MRPVSLPPKGEVGDFGVLRTQVGQCVEKNGHCQGLSDTDKSTSQLATQRSLVDLDKSKFSGGRITS